MCGSVDFSGEITIAFHAIRSEIKLRWTTDTILGIRSIQPHVSVCHGSSSLTARFCRFPWCSCTTSLSSCVFSVHIFQAFLCCTLTYAFVSLFAYLIYYIPISRLNQKAKKWRSYGIDLLYWSLETLNSWSSITNFRASSVEAAAQNYYCDR